jgi:sugar/nucleoside kinase (ribokinase family)
MTRFLVLGGAHLDRRATIATATRHGASNPGRWREEPGGGGLNAALNLARLGNAVSMVSMRGGDAAGETVSQSAEAAGIVDMAQVFLDRATPSYTAILEQNGDLVIGVADMDLYDHFLQRQLSRKSIREAIDNCDHILCDANLPESTLTALANKAATAGKPLAAIAISPAKITRLSGALSNLSILFLNQAEASTLCGSAAGSGDWPTRLRSAGLNRAVITRGAKALIAFDQHGMFEIDPPDIAQIADVTGAGDALAAGTLHALGNDKPFFEAVRTGIAASSITVRTSAAASPDLNSVNLDAALALVPEPVFLP